MGHLEETLKQILTPIIEEAIFKSMEKVNLIKEDSSEDILMGIEDTANFLQISKVTLHSLKKDGRLKYHRAGKKVLFKKSEVLEFINVKQQQ